MSTKRFLLDESGATATEYAMIASLAASSIGSTVGSKFNFVAAKVL